MQYVSKGLWDHEEVDINVMNSTYETEETTAKWIAFHFCQVATQTAGLFISIAKIFWCLCREISIFFG